MVAPLSFSLLRRVPHIAAQTIVHPWSAAFRGGWHSVKTNSSAKKRFKLTSSGMLRRAHAGKSHNTGKHKRKLIRMKGTTTTISCRKMERNMRGLLGLPTKGFA